MESEIVFNSLRDAAKHINLDRQAIYLAIKRGRLKAIKIKRGHVWHWVIKLSDLEEYKGKKYKASERVKDGKKIFDIESDRWSVMDVAKFTSLAPSRIYYLLRIGEIRAERTGSTYIIKKEEVMKIIDQETTKIKII